MRGSSSDIIYLPRKTINIGRPYHLGRDRKGRHPAVSDTHAISKAVRRSSRVGFI